MKMKKQGKSVGHSRPNNLMKKSPGPNKNNFKNQKAKNKPLKFLNDLKKVGDAKPLVKKVIGQGKVIKNPGKSLKKNKNKIKNRNQSKKGMAPPVNPDSIDKAVIEKSTDEEMIKESADEEIIKESADEEMIKESADEEMNEDNSSEGLESPASSPKKNKNKKKKLGLLAAKKAKENGDDGDNKEDEKDNENATPNAEKEGKDKHPKKFCLFVGNLPYDVKEEQIREHFKSIKNGLTTVRLMTHENTGKGRGFAFIELLNSGAYKAAIKLHKRKMGERIIRVEYTTPGKSDNIARKKFMHKKTKKLLGQKKHKKGKGFNKKKGKGKK